MAPGKRVSDVCDDLLSVKRSSGSGSTKCWYFLDTYLTFGKDSRFDIAVPELMPPSR